MMVETLALGRFHHQRLDFKRWIPAFLTSHRTLLTFLWIAAFASVFLWQRNAVNGFFSVGRSPARPMPKLRPVAFNLTDFGGVGDGVTLNTEAFERAIFAISKLGKKGGGQLNVPPGRWLTAPFNLTSHMTLFLAEDAEILGIQVGFYFGDNLFRACCLKCQVLKLAIIRTISIFTLVIKVFRKKCASLELEKLWLGGEKFKHSRKSSQHFGILHSSFWYTLIKNSIIVYMSYNFPHPPACGKHSHIEMVILSIFAFVDSAYAFPCFTTWLSLILAAKRAN